MNHFGQLFAGVGGVAIAILIGCTATFLPAEAQEGDEGDRPATETPLPELDRQFQPDITTEAIPNEELPPPLETGVLFRVIERRPPAESRFPEQQIEVHLMEDGRMFVFWPDQDRLPLCPVEPAVLEQFKRLLQEPEFLTYSGTSLPYSALDGANHTITLSSTSVTIQIRGVRGQLQPSEARLPDSISAVMRTFSYMTTCLHGTAI